MPSGQVCAAQPWLKNIVLQARGIKKYGSEAKNPKIVIPTQAACINEVRNAAQSIIQRAVDIINHCSALNSTVESPSGKDAAQTFARKKKRPPKVEKREQVTGIALFAADVCT